MYDVLIFGQGLAGSALACKLLQMGKTVIVVSDPEIPAASDVAAGLFNPLLVKRIKKTWMADTLFPLIGPFYRSFEQQLGCSTLLEHKPLVHIFESQSEQNDWAGKSSDPEFSAYIDMDSLTTLDNHCFHNPYGVMKVNHTGWLNTRTFLSECRRCLLSHSALIQETIVYDNLRRGNNFWQYNGIDARIVICCEGAGVSGNPYFSYLPFAPAKGEVLTLNIPGLQIPYTVHRGVFLMPLPDGTYRAGATYEWDDLTTLPTEKGKKELTDKLKDMLLLPFEIIGHEAGIRPSSMDRRPVLGHHHTQQGLYICNGFGTKAVSLLPYFSEVLLNHIYNYAPLPAEVSVSRFDKYHN